MKEEWLMSGAVIPVNVEKPPQRQWVGSGDLEDSNAYLTPPQRTERIEQNFCPRCGKRTKDIHTCTPPSQEFNT